MNNKHTPAPWMVHKLAKPIGSAEFEIHFSSDGECVAEVVHGEANARLIAAAPELLEAAQTAIRIKDLWCAQQFGTVSPKESERAELNALNNMQTKLEEAIAISPILPIRINVSQANQ